MRFWFSCTFQRKWQWVTPKQKGREETVPSLRHGMVEILEDFAWGQYPAFKDVISSICGQNKSITWKPANKIHGLSQLVVKWYLHQKPSISWTPPREVYPVGFSCTVLQRKCLETLGSPMESCTHKKWGIVISGMPSLALQFPVLLLFLL